MELTPRKYQLTLQQAICEIANELSDAYYWELACADYENLPAGFVEWFASDRDVV